MYPRTLKDLEEFILLDAVLKKPSAVSDCYLPSATDWHGGNEIIQEHWQELVWQAHWFLSIVNPVNHEDLFWSVAISGSSGLAVQAVERLSR